MTSFNIEMAESRYSLLSLIKNETSIEASYNELAIKIGVSRRTVIRATSDLLRHGLIAIEKRIIGPAQNDVNIYTITGKGVTFEIPGGGDRVGGSDKDGVTTPKPDITAMTPQGGGDRGGDMSPEVVIDSDLESNYIVELVYVRLLEIGVDEDVVLWLMTHASIQQLTDLILRFKQAVNIRNISGFFIDAVKRGWGAIIEAVKTTPKPQQPKNLPSGQRAKQRNQRPADPIPLFDDDDFSSGHLLNQDDDHQQSKSKATLTEKNPVESAKLLAYFKESANRVGTAAHRKYIEHAQLIMDDNTITIQLTGDDAEGYIKRAHKALDRSITRAMQCVGIQVDTVHFEAQAKAVAA